MSPRPRVRPGVVPVPSSEDRARVRLSGPGALAACLPQLIGFPPVESLVLVGLGPGRLGRREVGLTLRVDLDDVEVALGMADPDDQEDPDDFDEIHGERLGARFHDALRRPLPPCHPVRLVAALVRNGCVAAQVIVVSDLADPPPTAEGLADRGVLVVACLDAALGQAGLGVADALLVRDGRWWSYLCRRPTCCPPEGTLISRADSDLLAAELAWAGEPAEVLAGRDAIVAKVAPTSGPEATAAAVLLDSADRGRLASPDRAAALEAVADLMARFDTDEPDVEPEAWARLLVDLGDVGVRDGCLRPWKGQAGRRALALWCAATRLAPAGHVAAPATLAALTAHARGDGTLAGEAIARALTDDADYRLAGYAAQALGRGVPPKDIRRMLVEGTAVLRARGEPVLDAAGHVVRRAARS